MGVKDIPRDIGEKRKENCASLPERRIFTGYS